MDRPRSKVGPIVRGALAVLAILIAILWLVVAIRFIGGFISPDSGDAPGNVGHLFVAAFFLILAGPFVSVAYVLGMPLISKNPKFRSADR